MVNLSKYTPYGLMTNQAGIAIASNTEQSSSADVFLPYVFLDVDQQRCITEHFFFVVAEYEHCNPILSAHVLNNWYLAQSHIHNSFLSISTFYS